MDIVVPGDGFTIFRRNPATTFSIDALGPLSKGDFIRRVELHWNTEQAGVWSFAASLGSSNSRTDEALDAGIPLIQRSNFGAHAAGTGIPAIVVLGGAGQAGRMAFYPGLRVATGSAWIVVETGSQSMNVTASVLVSVEIWRREKQKDAPVGGP